LKTRTITGLILACALIFAIAMGGWVFSVLCILAIGVALHEMIHALHTKGHQVVRWPIWLATVLSIPCFLVYDNRMLMPILALTTMVIISYVLFHGEPKVEDILYSLMPFYAVSLPGMCLLAQINAPQRWLQVMLLFTSFVVPLAGDTLAYFIGSRFGKRKLIPAVSPNKSVEGAVGGVVFGTLALVLYGFGVGIVSDASPRYISLAITGIIITIISQIGDLVASAVKRHYGIKDYGKVFPGHGGVMDRFDSVIATAAFLNILCSTSSFFILFNIA